MFPAIRNVKEAVARAQEFDNAIMSSHAITALLDCSVCLCGKSEFEFISFRHGLLAPHHDMHIF